MDDFAGEFVYSALFFTYLGSLVLSPVYLVWATRRSVRRRRIPPNPKDVEALRAKRALIGDADVAFEARWGMVLAMPAIALSLLVLTDPARAPFGAWPAMLALLGIYAIAILAIARVTLWWWARWLPSVFAIVTTPVFVVAFPDGGPLWTSFLLLSGFGVSYTAEVVVGVRFARATRSRDEVAEFAAESTLAAVDSSFVWPY